MDKVIKAIEGLPRFRPGNGYMDRIGSGIYLKLVDVLRILREHAPQLARVVIADVDQGEEFKDLPAHEVRAIHPAWETDFGWTCVFSSEGELYRGAHWAADGRADLVDRLAEGIRFRPHGKTWAEVEQMAKDAALPRWRIALAKLRERQHGPNAILLSEIKQQAELEKFEALRLVIESGKGEAEVPECVARAVFGYAVGSVLMAARDGMYVRFRGESFGAASRMIDRVVELIDECGNALVADV